MYISSLVVTELFFPLLASFLVASSAQDSYKRMHKTHRPSAYHEK